MTSPSESRRYFGTDLAHDHVLPVLVVVEDMSPHTSFILQRQHAAIRMTDSKVKGDTSTVGSTSTGEALSWTTAGLIIAAPALAIPTMLAAGEELSKASIVKHTFEMNELRSTTLDPGTTTQGFLYFPLPKHRTNSTGILLLGLQEAGTKRFTQFRFPLTLEGK